MFISMNEFNQILLFSMSYLLWSNLNSIFYFDQEIVSEDSW